MVMNPVDRIQTVCIRPDPDLVHLYLGCHTIISHIIPHLLIKHGIVNRCDTVQNIGMRKVFNSGKESSEITQLIHNFIVVVH